MLRVFGCGQRRVEGVERGLFFSIGLKMIFLMCSTRWVGWISVVYELVPQALCGVVRVFFFRVCVFHNRSERRSSGGCCAGNGPAVLLSYALLCVCVRAFCVREVVTGSNETFMFSATDKDGTNVQYER